MSEDLDRLFIDTFHLAARQAGAVALHLQGKVIPETKSGESPEAAALTAVDFATQDVILYLLHRHLPEVAVDAEEETEAVELFAGRDPGRALVVVDPVDGTFNYIQGSSDFAVMGALLRDGCYTAGLIHFPVRGLTYWAIRGAGCFADASPTPHRLRAGVAEDRIYYSPGTPEVWQHSLAARAGSVELSRCSAVDASAPATGLAKAAVTPTPADRRRGIGLFLSLEAGGAVRVGGRPWHGEDPETLDPNFSPTLVTHSEDLADILMDSLSRQ